MLSLAGLLNLGQNVCAFSVLSFMTPTSYSIVNVTKRMVVITVSILMLRNPVTMANISGMAISIFGVLLYNKVCFGISAVCSGKVWTFHTLHKHHVYSMYLWM